MVDSQGGERTMDEAVDCLRDICGPDPVHPGANCYANLAQKLIEWLRAKKTV